MGRLEDEFDWREASWGNRFAYVFNRTALGIGAILTLYHAYLGNWWKFVLGLVFLGAYFVLHKIVDAPGAP